MKYFSHAKERNSEYMQTEKLRLRKFNLEFLQDGSKFINEMRLDKDLVWEIPNTAILSELYRIICFPIAIYQFILLQRPVM